jgi:uncharacterized RDD family membrane protein YckC
MERLDDVATVETPEQLELALPLAGAGSRSLAFIFDFLIQLIPIVVAMIVLITALAIEPFKGENAKGMIEGRLPLWGAAIFSVITFATNFLYFTFWDLVSRGQSPGKRALNLRVVRDGGLPIDVRSSLIRNFLRTVDMLPGFYVTGVVTIFLTKEHKRVGDLAGGTLVIRDLAEKVGVGDASLLLPPPRFAGSAGASAGNPSPLSPGDRALVHDFLDRRASLAEEARARVARQIADRLAPRYGIDPSLAADSILDELARR